jgi:GNAT superfamily N-acetyltransferase
MTASDIRIDPATPEDLPVILGMIKALAEYERMADDVVATAASLRTSLFGSRKGERPAVEVAIARVEGEPVGFALWFYNYSTFLGRAGLYLEDLFVLPAWRGRGVGRALLVHLARLAVARGCGRMEWSVLNWNEPAIAFYRRLGATPMDDWTVYRLTGDALTGLATSGDVPA